MCVKKNCASPTKNLTARHFAGSMASGTDQSCKRADKYNRPKPKMLFECYLKPKPGSKKPEN